MNCGLLLVRVFALAFFTCSALAQEANTLSGQVIDPAGGRIPGAEVTVRNAAGAERPVKTDSEGNFAVSGLAPGIYIVRVSAPGFATYENESVDVAAGGRTPLTIRLRIAASSQQITVTASAGSILDADKSAAMLVLSGAALDALPDGPGGMAAAIRVLSVRSANPRGPQVVVNGFSGGRLPPKSSIREIRINHDPFSAQYAQPGLDRVEIFTKPGTDTVHAGVYSYFNDESMNSRNPFAPERAAFQSRLYGGNVSGPITAKRASFFLDFERREAGENALINATVLDSDLRAVPFNIAVLTPQRRASMSTRLDHQLSASHTLAVRYAYTRGSSANEGIGEFSLPSRAYNTTDSEHTLQITETAFGQKAVNETRFQYVRGYRERFGNSTIPAIRVPDAFIAGGSETGASTNRQNMWEFHNTTMWVRGQHSMRAGGHVRSVRISDFSPLNFGGTFTFAGRSAPQLNAAGEIERDESGRAIMTPITTLESYRRTLFFQRLGLAPEEIRARGGGPNQFSIAGGDVRAKVTQYDASVFAQDDWRVFPNFTLSTGLRYETQNHIQSNLNFAPRVGLSWAPGKRAGAELVFRGGFGLFYERFSESYTLEARSRGGIKQQQYIVSEPGILDRFPSAPPVEMLTGFAVPRTITRVGDRIQAPYMMQTSFSVERTLPSNISVAATYINTKALHLIRSRNINAPLRGGGRPLGNAGEIFQYETSGRLNQTQLVTNVVQNSKRLTHYVTYVLNQAESDTDGAGSFPVDSYDLRAEYGRSSQDVRHTLYWGGWIKGPFNIGLSPVVVWRSGVPFNITTGSDMNGDSLYTERPAFAASPDSPGAVVTRFGMFDLAAPAGQRAIPRNYGTGPGFAAVHLRAGKTFILVSESTAQGKSGKRNYSMTVSLQIQNLFNHTNPDAPVGNLSSPLFGRSYSSAGDFGFGRNSAGNRRIEAQIYFGF